MIKGSRSEIQKKRKDEIKVKGSENKRSKVQKDQRGSKNRDTRKEDKRMTKRSEGQSQRIRQISKIEDQISTKEDYFMINVEREYKRGLFHDQCGARVQKRHHDQRGAGVHDKFPGE